MTSIGTPLTLKGSVAVVTRPAPGAFDLIHLGSPGRFTSRPSDDAHWLERGLEPAFIEEIAKGDRSAFSRLDKDIHRATAVIASSEQLALSVWHVAREAQLRVPRDLSIVGFGQPRFEFALWPTFTYIDQQPETIGRLAATMIVDADARRALQTRLINTEPVLVAGETTAPPPARTTNDN
ncbi:MAG: substrate-binding domain-containing protein [Tepidisphaeraceae bacterium]